jgi:hypothetical protein
MQRKNNHFNCFSMAATSSNHTVDDDLVFSKYTEIHLRATWKHAVRNNVVCSDEDKRMLMDGKPSWPDKCIITNIESVSTTTKRGKNMRAYPRKGVVKLSSDVKASKHKIGLHRLAAFIRDGRIPMLGQQASHFGCDNDRCVNPGHIVFEDAAANTTRYCCKLYKHVQQYRCPHQPPCPGVHSCFA